LVNCSRGGSASAGDTPAATAALPSPFPVVASFISKSVFFLFLLSSFLLLPFLPDALRDDFLQVFHIFGRSIMMLHFGAFARDVSRSERAAMEYTLQDFFHAERESVGLGEARDLRFAIARTQNSG